jgi:hypothetical protein
MHTRTQVKCLLTPIERYMAFHHCTCTVVVDALIQRNPVISSVH